VALLGRLERTPVLCQSEEEARELAASRRLSHEYPCYFFDTDTTGEKAEEEFYAPDELVDEEQYPSIRVVRYRQQPDLSEVSQAVQELRELIARDNLTKDDILSALRASVKSFSHAETNKYLDQRM
jgi:hypothetical protein